MKALPTKEAFAAEYEARLKANMPWAQDAAKLARFMDSVRMTLNGGGTWKLEGENYKATLKALGLPSSMTLKALHALPSED